jgi:hypothetical protein
LNNLEIQIIYIDIEEKNISKFACGVQNQHLLFDFQIFGVKMQKKK